MSHPMTLGSDAMRALLIVPSFLGHPFDQGWRKNPTVTPPLGPLYVAASLERAGFRVRFLDLNVEPIGRAEFCREVREASLVGVSVFTLALEAARALVDDVKNINPGAKVICGGPHINSQGLPFPGADLTFCGEAETTAGPVCRHLVRGELQALRSFQGLLWPAGSAPVERGTPMVLHSLDGLPRPARHLVDPSRYGELCGIRLAWRVAAIGSSRGCPSRCSFCVRRGVFRYRGRNPGEVVDEIAEIAANGADLLIFNEDNFLASRERALAIMRQVARRQLRLRLLVQARVDLLDEEVLAAFRDAGGWALVLGLESGTQEVLDYYGKGTTLGQAREAVALADRMGIFTFGFFILGAPPERPWHFRENRRFMTEIPLDFAGFNILDFQYGSALWGQKVREGILQRHELIVPTGPRLGALPYSELQRELRLSYRHFYLRPLHHARVLAKCLRVKDLTLFRFTLRFAAKLLRRFQAFALTEGIPAGVPLHQPE